MSVVKPVPEGTTGNIVAVAYSGGRDSSALLHATLVAAAPLGVHVVALHVHHGLSEHADAWLAHCHEQCASWARRGLPITFAAERLTGRPASGDRVEAWARERRYRALHRLAATNGATLVLLAHHRLDQAETFLLQALRGAGVAGLAAMPRIAQRDGIAWARPWLDQPGAIIEAYVRRHRLRHIEDESNADPRHARNRLRLQVWPAFSLAFPQAEAALAQSAEWVRQAAAGLAELAQMDLAKVPNDRGLDLQAWKFLSPARRVNSLRSWLQGQIGRAASTSLVMRLMSEVQATRSASWQCPEGTLRLYRGTLVYRRHVPHALPSQRESQLCVRRAGLYKLPGWEGQVRVQRIECGGVPMAWLGHLELRERSGGEQFQAGSGRPPRSLKKQYQAAAVPPWLRDGPLFYSGGQLIFVPGLGIDARVLAVPGQPQVALEWQRMPAAQQPHD